MSHVVAIGCSWGGMRALSEILGALPGTFSSAIVVAQHRDPDAEDDLLAHLLERHTPLPVSDADHGDELRPGRVLLAPPGYHLLVDEQSVALSVDEPVQFARPSVDVLFQSVAETYGPRAVGVVLTGANADGACGLDQIKRRGGYTIVQDPRTAERTEMPTAALEIAPHAVLPLEEIAPVLVGVCGQAEETA
jgi:two-component system, chemotaxis family, protein-glutamate methylesterase/glutaminase